MLLEFKSFSPKEEGLKENLSFPVWITSLFQKSYSYIEYVVKLSYLPPPSPCVSLLAWCYPRIQGYALYIHI